MDVFGKKDGRKMVCITKIAPTFPHLPLEVRNAELYDYRCPDAHWYTGYDTIACVLFCVSTRENP